MKIYGKVILIIIWLLLMLSFGYYTVFSNLGSILAAERPGFECRLFPEGIRLKLGDSVEVINFKIPLRFKVRDECWIVQTEHGTVSVSLSPRLRIQLKKSDPEKEFGE